MTSGVNERLRVLIVGCGAIAGGYNQARPSLPPLSHAAAFRGDARFEIAACVDPDRERRRDFMDHWSIPVGYDELSEVAASFDVVSICSPTPLHMQHVLAAVRLLPRLIFCEKPVGASLEDARRAVTACDDAGILLAVNYTRRWDPAVVGLRDDVAQGRLGAVRSAACFYNKGVVHNGSHMVDMLHFVLQRPLRLQAVGVATNDFFDDDPVVAALLEADGGISVHLIPADARDYALFELQLVTEQGSVAMEDGGLAWRSRRPMESAEFAGYKQLSSGERNQGEYMTAMPGAVANIYEALTTGAALMSTGHTALQAQQVCETIRSTALQQSGKSTCA